MQIISKQNLKIITDYKGWWAIITLVAAYLLFLLVQYYTSGAYALSDLLLWGACLGSLISAMVQLENDTGTVIKIAMLGLLAVTVNVQLYVLNAIYRSYIGNGFQMVAFFGLVLAAIVVLCHYDLQKRGWKRLNYTVVLVGFLFFGGLLASTLFYALR